MRRERGRGTWAASGTKATDAARSRDPPRPPAAIKSKACAYSRILQKEVGCHLCGVGRFVGQAKQPSGVRANSSCNFVEYHDRASKADAAGLDIEAHSCSLFPQNCQIDLHSRNTVARNRDSGEGNIVPNESVWKDETNILADRWSVWGRPDRSGRLGA